jgi:hypothetical protein
MVHRITKQLNSQAYEIKIAEVIILCKGGEKYGLHKTCDIGTKYQTNGRLSPQQ